MVSSPIILWLYEPRMNWRRSRIVRMREIVEMSACVAMVSSDYRIRGAFLPLSRVARKKNLLLETIISASTSSVHDSNVDYRSS